MSKLTKLLALAMAALMLLGMVSFASAEETPVLTIFIEECATVEDFETNLCTLWFEEQLGCDLQFIVAPTGSASEKMNVLLNDKNYPDIFYKTVPEENLYGIETGIMMDLRDLITPELMPNLYQLMQEHSEIAPAITSFNGAIYYFPAYGGTALHSQYPAKMFYNTANLEKLGLDVPETLDDLYEAMVAWKELDENNIPMVGCNDLTTGDPTYYFTNAFTYQGSGDSGYKMGFRVHENTIETMFDDEEYREALAFMNKLFSEGLIDESIWTSSTEQAKALLAQEGEPVLFWATTHNAKFVVAGDTPELYAHTRTLDPIKGDDGTQYTTYVPDTPKGQIAIASTCAYPEIAAKFVDLHYSTDGVGVLNFGPQSEGHWRYSTDEEKQQCVDAGADICYIIRLDAFDSGIQNFKWQPQIMNSSGIKTGWTMPVDYSALDFNDAAQGSNYRLYSTTVQYVPYYQTDFETVPSLSFTADEKDQKASLTVAIENYVASAKMDFITGVKDINDDDIWDAYVKGMYDMGIETILEIYQNAYDRAN